MHRSHIVAWTVGVLVTAAVIALIAAASIRPSSNPPSRPLAVATVGTPLPGVARQSIPSPPTLEEPASCYVPPYTLFRLVSWRGTIDSYYDDEASLLFGHQPCQDSDYLLPYAAQEQLTLPGPSWVSYTVLGVGWVDGSGYYEAFAAPNGGRFAYLHVHGPLTVGAGRKLPGGAAVGHSGWPFSYQWSNGSCYDNQSCQADAHLCVVADRLAAEWFYRLLTSPPPRPQVFPVTRWERYQRSHGRPDITYLYKGRLTSIASHWWKGRHDSSCGGVRANERYNAAKKLSTQLFSHGAAYEWPLAKGPPVKFVC